MSIDSRLAGQFNSNFSIGVFHHNMCSVKRNLKTNLLRNEMHWHMYTEIRMVITKKIKFVKEHGRIYSIALLVYEYNLNLKRRALFLYFDFK